MKTWTFIVLLAAVGLAACTASKQAKRTPFSITEATAQEQLPGVQGAGNSQEFRFQAIIKTDAFLKFDSVWVNGNRLAIKIVKDGKLLQNATTFKAGDTITLAASHYEPGERETGNVVQQTGKVKWPVLANGDALIRYTLNDRPAYYPVATITALPPVILP